MNLALFYRELQIYEASTKYWLELKNLQEKIYVDDNEVLIFTYKNIGINNLAMG
jgi:hypothetical protein